MRAARDLGATGTPTVLINGWDIRGGIDEKTLHSLAAREMRFPGREEGVTCVEGRYTFFPLDNRFGNAQAQVFT